MGKYALLTLVALTLTGCGKNDGSSATSQEKGVVLLRYSPGSESTEQREQGFIETMKSDYPEIAIISDDQYAGISASSALEKSQQLILKFGPQISGVFAVNESSADGMFTALEENNLLDQVQLIGFDPNERMVQALSENKMEGIVLQDPVKMGYLAVKTIYDHLEGQQVEKRVPTGESVATPENMNEAEMAALLTPEQFSGADLEPTETKYSIAVIPKGTSHEFWKSVHAGAHQAAQELKNVRILWKGPIREDDADGQIDVMRDFVTKKVDGICLAPLDSQALLEVVKEANSSGIPTVVFDSNLVPNDAQISYVATDNYQGGAKAAHKMAELLKVAK
ncbi:MAG: substrate-binding domain-containing protein [Planctomycetaceae bacterium]|nr:substrate-binding domain-containing protein [Planctomycetaceae bacterium]